MKFITESYHARYDYKIDAKLNDAKNNLEKISEMAKQLGVFAGDIDKMKEESLSELQKILLSRS